eukprot:CAMPEP_0170537610 /NCGR_PEP_ID=MMETSP0209-20121228/102816_1 /TAXON_ID=665100 ORGANISM="Litonotus pictus, Strain P1" /NCGR_SAMPLE_ID=MMETSP0209 /ASSEMBLY_ACC=CAM_ASM_000301 /LENGTH=478 /DNA_ID=CAMNT_0010839143 /DNA_START=6645 /DNA_END=8081 /DNA_ORIENTATION=-
MAYQSEHPSLLEELNKHLVEILFCAKFSISPKEKVIKIPYFCSEGKLLIIPTSSSEKTLPVEGLNEILIQYFESSLYDLLGFTGFSSMMLLCFPEYFDHELPNQSKSSNISNSNSVFSVQSVSRNNNKKEIYDFAYGIQNSNEDDSKNNNKTGKDYSLKFSLPTSKKYCSFIKTVSDYYYTFSTNCSEKILFYVLFLQQYREYFKTGIDDSTAFDYTELSKFSFPYREDLGPRELIGLFMEGLRNNLGCGYDYIDKIEELVQKNPSIQRELNMILNFQINLRNVELYSFDLDNDSEKARLNFDTLKLQKTLDYYMSYFESLLKVVAMKVKLQSLVLGMKTPIEKELRYDNKLGYKGGIELWVDFSGFDSEYHKYFNDQDAKYRKDCGFLGESGERNRIECMILERAERNDQLLKTLSSSVLSFVRSYMKENDGITTVGPLQIETKFIHPKEIGNSLFQEIQISDTLLAFDIGEITHKK